MLIRPRRFACPVARSTRGQRYHPAMLDDDPISIAFDPPDTDLTHAHYLETCRRAGIEQVSRERAEGSIAEWNEALSGRPEPLQQ